MASIFKACRQSVTSHREFIMAGEKALYQSVVNNEPCQLIEEDSTSPSQRLESKEVTINRNASFGLCVVLNTPWQKQIVFAPHYVSTFPPTLSLQASYQARSKLVGKKCVLICIFHIMHVLIVPSHSSNNQQINIQDKSQMISMFRNFIFPYPSLQVFQKFNCSVSVKRQAQQ